MTTEKGGGPRILIVDDDDDTRANLRDILELDEYRVAEADSAAAALRRENLAGVMAVLLDRKLPDGSAEELLPRLRRLAPQAAILIVTGYSDLHGAIDALRQGAADYILKPINPDALRASLARVAERQRLAREKERTEAAFRSLIEAAPCMIVILRSDHRIAYFSPWAEELTGYRAADVLGQDYVATFVPEPNRAGFAAEIARSFAGGRTREAEHIVLCRDGSQRWMVMHRRLLHDYEGAAGVLVVGQDITAAKKAQEQLLQTERLAAIGQMMAGLAHESGNALARSQSCLEMLAWEVEDRPEALELIRRVQKAQDDLRQLYEEVRGYAAPLRLEREPQDVRLVWRRAWDSLQLARREKDAALREEIEGVEPHASIDLFRLEQVFRNILENALAAGRPPVEITVRLTDAQLDGRPALRVSFCDNGPGLNPEQRRRIFEPFFTTKTKGTGLGMAIARRIVEAHGGQIAVGDLGPPGAELIVTLPRGGS
jgi:two-component system sensor kinase FixL